MVLERLVSVFKGVRLQSHPTVGFQANRGRLSLLRLSIFWVRHGTASPGTPRFCTLHIQILLKDRMLGFKRGPAEG